MKQIFIIAIALISSVVYAEPYKCLTNNATFADNTQCEQTCGTACEELVPSSASSAGACDTTNYQGFVAMDGKTYAVSKQPITWHNKLATPKTEMINNVLAGILKRFSISSAFIGVADLGHSLAFDTVDPSRFTFTDNTATNYSNWNNGEPNNHYDPSLSGVNIYGEHWATIDSNGKWNDVAETVTAPGIFEWNGQLSCTVGNVKQDTSIDTVSDQMCTDNKPNENGIVSLFECETGSIFGENKQGSLCTAEKTACVKTTYKEQDCSSGTCIEVTKEKYTCPYTDRPCIEQSGQYYCSPYDCSSSTSALKPNVDEVPEGTNDANNNGEIGTDGKCLGQVIIFPGRDSRCRPAGTQTYGYSCCDVMSIEDADKPDFRASQDQVAAALYAVGGPATIWLYGFLGSATANICSGNEKQLGVNRGMDMCKEIGTYCAEDWFGSCVQRKSTYCCFDSDFSRYFAEAGYDLLDRSWGTPENPNCSGFTPEELQLLSSMGISNHPKLREYAEKVGAEVGNDLLNEFNSMVAPTITEDNLQQQVNSFLEGSDYE